MKTCFQIAECSLSYAKIHHYLLSFSCIVVNHQDIAAQTIASGSKTFMPDRKNPTAKTTMRMVCQNMNIT